MLPDECLRREQISAFLLGRLSVPESDRVARHLVECPDCDRVAGALESETDELADRLREPASFDEYEREPDCLRALEAIERLGLDPAVPGAAVAQHGAELGQLREYRLLAVLGRGGMGTVYQALHTKLNKVVALKVLPAERVSDPEAVRRFEREMQAVGQLDHPHIVRATDAGEVEGTHFLVMEFVPGLDLGELLRRRDVLSVCDACELVRQAALGLQHAHEHGLVHRDIKPSNLLLTAGGTVKVLDLGLALLGGAHISDEGLTTTGHIIGTVDYISPEQATDAHGVDIRADLYSLGCTLFRLLAGRVPYGAPNHVTPYQKVRGHVEEAVPSVREHRADVPEPLDGIIGRLMAKSPDARFATPAELAEALAPFAAGSDLQRLSADVQAPAPEAIETRHFVETTVHPLSSAASDTSAPASREEPVQLAVEEPVAAGAARVSGRRRRRGGRWGFLLATAAVLLGAAWYAAGLVLRLETPEGTLVLEYDQPELDGATVSIDGTQALTIRTGDSLEPVTVAAAPGRRLLEVKKGGFRTFVREFEVATGKQGRIRVSLEPLEDPLRDLPAPASAGASTEPLWLQLGRGVGFSDPVNLGAVVNSSANEVSPCLSADGLTLYFSSGREGGHGGMDLWMATRRALDQPFEEPVNLGSHVNSEAGEWGPAVSEDELTLYFYSNRPGAGRMDLWMSERRDVAEPFGPPVPLEPINTDASEGHPTISRDGLTLLYVSNRPGGLGGTDIYMAVRASRKEDFAPPVHLAEISSPQSEYWLQLTPDDRALLFGSFREPAPGGEDLWMARRRPDGSFEPPQHLGALLNAHGKEGRATFTPDGRFMIFNSTTPGGHGGHDLWQVELIPQRGHSPEGSHSYALHFDGRSAHVEIPTLALDGGVPLTVEAWILPETGTTAVPVFKSFGREAVSLWMGPGTRCGLAVHQPEGGAGATARGLPIGVPVHLAATWDGKQARLFIDGAPAGEPDQADAAKPGFVGPALIGAHWTRDRSTVQQRFHGIISALRISSTLRYSEPFTPHVHFEADEETLALYHFDEGRGTTLRDSSGNGHHGRIVGGAWVPHVPRSALNAASREAAEWALSRGGRIELEPHGETSVLPDPAGPVVLRGISLSGCREVTDEDLVRLGSIVTLEHLNLGHTAVTSAGMRHVIRLRRLARLNVGLTNVDGTGLAMLKELPQLTELKLAVTRMSEADLMTLPDFPALNSLTVNASMLSPPVVERLGAMPRLTELHVGGATDDMLPLLASFGHLRKLRLNYVGAGLTQAGIADLRRRLPNVNVIVEWPDSQNTGPAGDVLPGVLRRPAALPGVSRWQIETVAPRGAVLCTAYSPDGRLIACGSEEGQVRVYDAGTRRLVRLLSGHTETVRALSWSPDGERLASASEDRTVRIWSADGLPESVWPALGPVFAVAWHPDGQRIASTYRTGRVRIWNRDGKPERDLGYDGRMIWSAAWSPDGTRLVVGGDRGEVLLYDVAEAAERTLPGHNWRTLCVAWHPEGTHFATGGNDGAVRIWDADGTMVAMLDDREGVVSGLCWDPQGRRVAAADSHCVRVWDIASREAQSLEPRQNHFCVCWSPDGSTLAAGAESARLQFWSADGTLLDPVQGFRRERMAAAWSPDGGHLVTAANGSVSLWTPDGSLRRTFDGIRAGSLAWHPDGRRFAAAGPEGLRMWDTKGRTGPAIGLQDVQAVCFSPDGRWLATGHRDGRVRSWTLEGAPGPFEGRHDRPVARGLRWSPDSRRLASGAGDGTVCFWNADGTAGPVLDVGEAIQTLAWHPSGETLAVATNRLSLWTPGGTRSDADFGFRGKEQAVAWSPDGARLATASHDGSIRTWSPNGTPDRLFGHHRAHLTPALDWSPDGRRVVSGSADATFVVWNAETARPEWVVLYLSQDRLIALSAAGAWLAGDTPEDLDTQLTCLLEMPDGRRQLLSPSAFYGRFAADVENGREQPAAPK